MNTVTICIGNSDDKLTQKEWSEFITMMNKMLRQVYAETQFSGFSAPNAPWQNACWVVGIHDHKIEDLKNRIRHIRGMFKQDSVAVVVGETEFV
jgi:hypothetical protein